MLQEKLMKSIFASLILSLMCQTSFAMHTPDDSAQLENLKNVIKENKKLKNLDDVSLADFANRILYSGYSYDIIKHRINHNLKTKFLPFPALEKALASEDKNAWSRSRIANLIHSPDSIANEIKKLNLNHDDYDMALALYAVCIEPWTDSYQRQKHFTPHVCDGFSDAYDHLRHYSDSVSIRTRPTVKHSKRAKAYNILVNAGRDVIKSENLSDLEMLLMAKCIAENSVRFKSPQRHPVVAVREACKASLISPQNALFQDKGVCNNISGITYNMALALGFDKPLFLARHHLHVFLETHINEEWLHLHPLTNTPKNCDFIRF
jgi:predicted 2-oxoglutarate/Fe(II)-dependent dioxygenase YbiX